ncbi:MAG: hypothetical protein MRJ93_09550 [Nitrososphaeraceae archaeon]|nr:hypothetical protein [Nitrososphaeraceae archaeon]
MQIKSLFLIIFTMIVLYTLAIPTTEAEDNVKEHEKWLKEYWRYALNISNDETVEQGNLCLINNPTNTSFPIMLLDPFEVGYKTQTCILPSDRELLIPAYTGECDTGSELGSDASSEEILQCALGADAGYLDFTLTLDGKRIVDIKDVSVGDNPTHPNFFEVQTGKLFEVNLPEDSEWIDIYPLGAGTYQAQAHGFFAKLDKLAPGNHTLGYTQTVSGTRGLGTQGGWSGGANKVLYDITIK